MIKHTVLTSFSKETTPPNSAEVFPSPASRVIEDTLSKFSYLFPEGLTSEITELQDIIGELCKEVELLSRKFDYGYDEVDYKNRLCISDASLERAYRKNVMQGDIALKVDRIKVLLAEHPKSAEIFERYLKKLFTDITYESLDQDDYEHEGRLIICGKYADPNQYIRRLEDKELEGIKKIYFCTDDILMYGNGEEIRAVFMKMKETGIKHFGFANKGKFKTEEFDRLIDIIKFMGEAGIRSFDLGGASIGKDFDKKGLFKIIETIEKAE